MNAGPAETPYGTRRLPIQPACYWRKQSVVAAGDHATVGQRSESTDKVNVFVTAFPTDALRAQVATSGALAVLEKPPDIAALEHHLTRAPDTP
ncbi:hypothetical protein [Pararobbsia alpina]|uniref:hypothetical protein n=1 Tax=Pararobbsia alpina TaxID=621374 RepID=UPI00158228BA|nr:hypothetical protein [Pararobbsia alpina]